MISSVLVFSIMSSASLLDSDFRGELYISRSGTDKYIGIYRKLVEISDISLLLNLPHIIHRSLSASFLLREGHVCYELGSFALFFSHFLYTSFIWTERNEHAERSRLAYGLFASMKTEVW